MAYTYHDFDEACKSGDLKRVQTIYAHSPNFNTKMAMNWACECGHVPIVEFLTSNKNDEWYWGMVSACVGGQLEVVKFIISKNVYNWDLLMVRLCIIEHMRIINYIITKTKYPVKQPSFEPKQIHALLTNGRESDGEHEKSQYEIKRREVEWFQSQVYRQENSLLLSRSLLKIVADYS